MFQIIYIYIFSRENINVLLCQNNFVLKYIFHIKLVSFFLLLLLLYVDNINYSENNIIKKKKKKKKKKELF